ncbi:MAG: type III glutamate--ammonia ligase, partial [Gammaproteobacteria bacterium]|nr:type III glutamate--ammonia ligase [Gammaproteobacteria bacterium]
GVLHHAPALCALTNPTVNSYKRINAPVTSSGATWSPNTVTWAGNNRTHMVRVPEPGRFECRLPDGAANPYLLQAAFLAAGLDGIENERRPGKRLDVDMYAEGHKVRATRLPLYLIDALRNLDASKLFRATLGDEFIDAFLKMKTIEWDDHARQLTDWERHYTMDV